jgi:hypothetical protein
LESLSAALLSFGYTAAIGDSQARSSYAERTHSLQSATGGYAMKSYELPIDLETLKANARPLPGITETQRNWSAVREQMHGYDRSGAAPDERAGESNTSAN